MAGISFLDLMLADALAAGLAREARRAERPPPDNFFVMPRELRAWKNIQEASKKEYMVVCMEFTDERGHTPFVNLAREFDSIPFLRVPIGLGPGGTFEELRKDLGGVQYIPTILIIFYGENGKIFRAKFEGGSEIRQGLANGRIKTIIKEFIERRVKLKLTEHVAEELADAVKNELSEKERKIRDEYESKMRREMAEKDEQVKQAEEEKKRKEEEEQRKLEQKRMRANEIRREARPQHLEELMRMDLDKASSKELKQIMMKMGIPTHDCFEKSDLKKKLIDNVPELRMEMERRRSSTSSTSSFASPSSTSSFDFNSRNTSNASFSSSSELEEVKRELTESKTHLRQMTVRANQAEDTVVSLKVKIKCLEGQIGDLQDENKTLKSQNTPKSGLFPSFMSSSTKSPVPKPRSSLASDSGRVKQLETELLVTRTLYTSTIEDFKILSLIHDSGEEGMVLRAKCIKPTLPNRDKVYAMKVLTNYFQTQTQTQARHQFQNEYQVLCQLPPHDNIIHMWAFFFDRADPDASSHFKSAGKNVRTMSLFLLMDEHPQNMKELLSTLVDLQGPKADKVVEWFRDLLNGLEFLEQHNIVHRDLKLENLLYSDGGKVIISDFGKAVVLDRRLQLDCMFGMDKGGNTAHMSPEILNARPGRGKTLCYVKQPVWAAGVLAHELAGHASPFESGILDQRGYHNDNIPSLTATYCTNTRYRQSLPTSFTSLVKRMLSFEPDSRPTLKECLDIINKLV